MRKYEAIVNKLYDEYLDVVSMRPCDLEDEDNIERLCFEQGVTREELLSERYIQAFVLGGIATQHLFRHADTYLDGVRRECNRRLRALGEPEIG
jgi:hypothetical protein